MTINYNFHKILDKILCGSLGKAELEFELRSRIVSFVEGNLSKEALYAEIVTMHNDTFETLKVSEEELKWVMSHQGFEAFLKAITSSENPKPNYPAIKSGNLFKVFLPDKTYEAVPYGGEFEDYRALDKHIQHSHPETPVVYHVTTNKEDEFVFVLGHRDEYIII